MAVRPCLPWPHPCLKTPAAAVTAITDEVRSLWADMIDTMDAMPGYGLAAVQIGVALQLVFYATPVIYPPSFVDTHLAQGSHARLLLEANPLYAFVQAFRDLMWSLALPTARTWLVALAWTAIALIGGWLIFRDRAYLVAEGA